MLWSLPREGGGGVGESTESLAVGSLYKMQAD